MSIPLKDPRFLVAKEIRYLKRNFVWLAMIFCVLLLLRDDLLFFIGARSDCLILTRKTG